LKEAERRIRRVPLRCRARAGVSRPARQPGWQGRSRPIAAWGRDRRRRLAAARVGPVPPGCIGAPPRHDRRAGATARGDSAAPSSPRDVSRNADPRRASPL